jgi:hypothetical protein
VGWVVVVVVTAALGMLASNSSSDGTRYALHILAFAAFWAGALVVVIALVNRSRPKWRSLQYWFFWFWAVFAFFAVIDLLW